MSFSALDQKDAAFAFVEKWKNKGDEKQDTHNFWHELLLTVYGVSNPSAVIEYEKRVHLGHTSYIDGYIPSSKVLIEQKGYKIDLNKKEKQSDGEELTPYEQAFRYAGALPLSEKPRYIVTCNFRTFQIYDQNHEDPLNQTPLVIQLEELPKAFTSLDFLVDLKAKAREAELDISVKAGSLIGKLYDSVIKQYDKETASDPIFLQNLNKLCVRLVFCLYAEDAFLFPKKNQFGDFLKTFSVENINTGLEKLFRILNTKETERPKLTDPKYLAFPYVNGGLFADHEYEIPVFSQESADILIKECSDGFDWSGISPTIFGAMFESTLNPETRRAEGMHYTSIENIHKVIDPLFLDEIKAEYQAIEDKIFKERHLADAMASKVRVGLLNEDKTKLENLQRKIASLKFLDPACGSGNFLTETYLCLRRIENKILLILNGQQMDLFRNINIQVSISNFYGIEINDFAVSVAKTALWIAEAQMLDETNNLLGSSLQFLPLKSFDHIVEGNALRMDWNEVIPASELNYIMGNPPFCGRRYRSEEQIKDVASFFEFKDIDYVACWYKKSVIYMQNNLKICAGFVSTNSITQGEQVAALWSELFDKYGIEIAFAYRTFRWDSDSSSKAAVHVVIVEFTHKSNIRKEKYIIDGAQVISCQNINGYLIDAPSISIISRNSPLCNVPKMQNGNVPLDGDALKIEDADYQQFASFKYVKRLVGGRELLHNEKRYVLWLVGVSPNEYKSNNLVMSRIEQCKNNRLLMKDKSSQKLAQSPALFRDTNNPSRYIALPMVSSERRTYLPMDYLDENYIPTNQVQTIPNAELYHFGILTSSTHMAWMRTVAGRLKSDYRYSKDIVYNNFIWMDATEEQKEKISKAAQAILDARALYPDSSLADLYDPLTMPPELLKAHKANDKAVLALYGFKADATEEDIVAKLMQMYAEKVKQIDK